MIDAHHHLWKYNDRDYAWMSGAMEPLRRDFLVADLSEAIRSGGVSGTVVVQARQTVEETEWLLALAEANDCIRGVVGWVPLVDAGVASHLERFARHPKLKGMRHVLHDEPDDGYMLRSDFNRGVALLKEFRLTYDILICERHLPQTLEFVDRHPNQVFIVDHIAKPRIKDRLLSPWRERIQELAKREHVYCKISGMLTEADWKRWTPEELKPYFDTVLSAFLPARLMFGTDWPVLTLASDYATWAHMFRQAIAELSAMEKERISEGTAVEAYRLQPCEVESKR